MNRPRGKCTVFAEKSGTFPGGRDCKCGQRGLWSRCPSRPWGKVNRFRRNSRHFPRWWKLQMRQEQRERLVEPVARPPRWRVPFRKKADFRTFTMSNTPLKCIILIIRRIYFSDLLDYPLFATKPPFHPRSSRCSFSEYLYTKHFPKHALLDLLKSLMLRGKVHRFRRNSRHFPRGERLQVRPERPVEPVPLSAAGESEPFSRKFPALSPEEGLGYSWKVLEI